jgi:hypothetical protein
VEPVKPRPFTVSTVPPSVEASTPAVRFRTAAKVPPTTGEEAMPLCAYTIVGC